MELLNFIFKSIEHFIGSVIILAAILKAILILWYYFWKGLIILRHGYPPKDTKLDKEDEELF